GNLPGAGRDRGVRRMSVEDRRILVTSGPTRAPLDAVRFFTNKSTGRLGALIAEAAVQGGADVTFVYGRGSETPAARGGQRDHLRLVPVDTVDDLRSEEQTSELQSRE